MDTCRGLGIDGDDAETFADLAVLVLAGSQNLCGPVDEAMVARASTALDTQIRAAIPAPATRPR